MPYFIGEPARMNTDMASPFSSRDTLLETAWAALSHKQQAHCKVSVLQAEVSWQWERARNRIIAGWAAHTLAAVPTMVLRNQRI